MIKTETITYFDDKTELEGFYAYDDANSASRPAVLVAHDWTGRNEFACKKAQRLAEMGYVGFALDMFGKGILGKTKEEKSALIQPFVKNRSTLQKRMLTSLQILNQISIVDKNKIGAIGFCFGGLCVLDLARSGADVKAIVSFHGLLNAPENIPDKKIKAQILALHGFDDPMVPHEAIIAFGNEMTKAKADWELTMYGNTMHAFTNPDANDPGFGTVYNKKIDARSWIAMKNFFEEVFAS